MDDVRAEHLETLRLSTLALLRDNHDGVTVMVDRYVIAYGFLSGATEWRAPDELKAVTAALNEWIHA